MLQNAYLLAKIGADTAENERNVAENCSVRADLVEFAEALVRLRAQARGVGARLAITIYLTI